MECSPADVSAEWIASRSTASSDRSRTVTVPVAGAPAVTAFAANSPVLVADVRWASGRESIREYESSPGKFRAFCGRCGSPIYARLVAQPDWLYIRLGLIGADPGHRAQAHFNVGSKAAWFTVTDELPQYDGDTETDSPETQPSLP